MSNWPFVRGIHQWLVDSPHKGPVMQIMFPFDDIIMVNEVTMEDIGKIIITIQKQDTRKHDPQGYWSVGIIVFPYSGSRIILIQTLRLRQNGHHFADNILKFIVSNKDWCIFNQISLKCVPKGSSSVSIDWSYGLILNKQNAIRHRETYRSSDIGW